MGLEAGTFISDFVRTNPLGSDDRSTADDHLRLIKDFILNTFPNLNDACNMTDEELNFLVGVTSAIQTQINNTANATHTGDVTGSGILTIALDIVTNAKAANMAQDTLKGRASGAGTGDPTDLTVAQVKAILGIPVLTQPDVAMSGSTTTLTGIPDDCDKFEIVLYAVSYNTTGGTWRVSLGTVTESASTQYDSNAYDLISNTNASSGSTFNIVPNFLIATDLVYGILTFLRLKDASGTRDGWMMNGQLSTQQTGLHHILSSGRALFPTDLHVGQVIFGTNAGAFDGGFASLRFPE